MALVGFLGYSLIISVKAGFAMVAQDVYDVLSTYGFTVIPFSSLWDRLLTMEELPRDSMIQLTDFWGTFPEDWQWQRWEALLPSEASPGLRLLRQQPLPVLPFLRWTGMGIAGRSPQGLWRLQGLSVVSFLRVSLLSSMASLQNSPSGSSFSLLCFRAYWSLYFHVYHLRVVQHQPLPWSQGGKVVMEGEISIPKRDSRVAIIFIVVMGGMMQGLFTLQKLGVLEPLLWLSWLLPQGTLI